MLLNPKCYPLAQCSQLLYQGLCSTSYPRRQIVNCILDQELQSQVRGGDLPRRHLCSNPLAGTEAGWDR